MLVSKWILVYFMYSGYKGGPDHIEFKTQTACYTFMRDLMRANEGMLKPYLHCECIAVYE